MTHSYVDFSNLWLAKILLTLSNIDSIYPCNLCWITNNSKKMSTENCRKGHFYLLLKNVFTSSVFFGANLEFSYTQIKMKVFCSIYPKILGTLDRITMSQQHNMFHFRNSRDAQRRMNVAMIYDRLRLKMWLNYSHGMFFHMERGTVLHEWWMTVWIIRWIT